MLYGTKISPAGADQLKAAAADTAVKIDYRRGAFLGVGCHQTEAGCAIAQVHPGSCAEKGGVQEGDIVLSYNDKPVKTFEDLTGFIAENVAGDKVTLKLKRFDEELTKELTLGEWE
jgi:S1-C subfamily serine protease